MTLATQLTADSLATFKLYANDAPNWGGNPWVSHGNISPTKAMRGNLSDLVQKGLIEIQWNDHKYIQFTAAGHELATELGIAIGD